VGKSTINGPFSTAMLNYQRVIEKESLPWGIFHCHDGFPCGTQARSWNKYDPSMAGNFLQRCAFILLPNHIPSGKHTKNYGQSPFLMGKSTIYGHFQ
jgi:hypothetical protein